MSKSRGFRRFNGLGEKRGSRKNKEEKEKVQRRRGAVGGVTVTLGTHPSATLQSAAVLPHPGAQRCTCQCVYRWAPVFPQVPELNARH